ncbi:DUF1990 family protein [Lacipirellula sp.]|uniref:DUF1990 family protein n=1 Tax=Lacipirellula sp. TaxID=2691419 RepID=UPI003D10063F
MGSLSFTKPTEAALRQFIAEQHALPFTYEGVGATADEASIPAGYAIDRMSVSLGRGEAVFAAAKQGLKAWQQFQLGWCEAWPRTTPIRHDETVAVVARSLGTWWTNAARIVYVIDEANRFGFAYGTLPGHVEMGEELFLLERDPVSGETTYSILAFSRPRHPLAKLGRPMVRRLQQRFRDDSAAAMLRWIEQQA